jgi:hypothetical protein
LINRKIFFVLFPNKLKTKPKAAKSLSPWDISTTIYPTTRVRGKDIKESARGRRRMKVR